MKTLSYIYSNIEDVVIGNTYYFGQLWDGDGGGSRGRELLESGCVALYQDNYNCVIVDFDIIMRSKDILQTFVKVTDISV